MRDSTSRTWRAPTDGSSDGGIDLAALKSQLHGTDLAISFIAIGGDVDKAALTLTANDQSKTYGDAFSFAGTEFASIGLQNGETVGSVMLTSAATSTTANAGSHAITAASATGGTFDIGNYEVTYNTGSFTVDKAALTVTANDASKTYDGLAFTGGMGVTFSGFVNSEDDSVLGGTLAYGGTAQNAVNAGDYTLTASGLTSGNYDFNYVDGMLRVSKAVISAITGLTASDKVYDGSTAATLDTSAVDFSGLISGDRLGRCTFPPRL